MTNVPVTLEPGRRLRHVLREETRALHERLDSLPALAKLGDRPPTPEAFVPGLAGSWPPALVGAAPTSMLPLAPSPITTNIRPGPLGGGTPVSQPTKPATKGRAKKPDASPSNADLVYGLAASAMGAKRKDS